MERLRVGILMGGSALLLAGSVGIGIFNSRWFSVGSNREWGRQYMTSHGMVCDSVIASAVLGLICACMVIAAVTLFVFGFDGSRAWFAFAAAVVFFVLEGIPDLIIIIGCDGFSATNNLWVHYSDRNYYDADAEYRSWVDGFWHSQIGVGGSMSGSLRDMMVGLTTVGGPWFQIPMTELWDPSLKTYLPKQIYSQSGQGANFAFACVIDFRAGAAYYDYRNAAGAMECDFMKVRTIDCIGRWNQEDLQAELKRTCRQYWYWKEQVVSAKTAREYSDAEDVRVRATTKTLIEESLAAVLLATTICFGIQCTGACLIAIGVVISVCNRERLENELTIL